MSNTYYFNKKLLYLFIAVFGLGSLTSCLRCDKDIELGVFEMMEQSKEFMSYDKSNVLIYLDQDGVETRFVYNHETEFTDSKMIVRTICDEGLLDKQHEYYTTNAQSIRFIDSLVTNNIELDLRTSYEDHDDIDSIAIYDVFTLRIRMRDTVSMKCSIIPGVHQNELSDDHINNLVGASRFVGDTIIQGKQYNDLYEGVSTFANELFYYNKEKGVVFMDLGPDNYLQLKE